jgi:hypothetical protein
MAITQQSVTMLPKGGGSVPSAGVTVASVVNVEPAFISLVNVLGDAAATTFTFNFIDGVNALSYIPSAVLVFLATPPATSPAATGVLAVEGSNAAPRVTSITATSCVINFSTTIPATAGGTNLLVLVFR